MSSVQTRRSSPAGRAPTILNTAVAQWTEHNSAKVEGAGSTPASRTKFLSAGPKAKTRGSDPRDRDSSSRRSANSCCTDHVAQQTDYGRLTGTRHTCLAQTQAFLSSNLRAATTFTPSASTGVNAARLATAASGGVVRRACGHDGRTPLADYFDLELAPWFVEFGSDVTQRETLVYAIAVAARCGVP